MVVVEASGVGLRTRRGWVFRDVDLTVGAGELHAVTGPPGSGRTSLLLALAGRFPTSEGRLVRHGSAALGQVSGVHEPDPELTVAEHVAERLLLLGRRARLGGEWGSASRRLRSRRAYRREAVAAAIDGAGLGGMVSLDPGTRGRDLTPVQRQALGLVLATLAGPALIVADDVDAGTDGAERAWLWGVLGRLAEQGYAVVVSARAVEPGTSAVVHRLGDPSTVPPPAPLAADADDHAAAGHATTVRAAAQHDNASASHSRSAHQDASANHDRSAEDDDNAEQSSIAEYAEGIR
jgi:ABC-2 type transport system ATP-binding protein